MRCSSIRGWGDSHWSVGLIAVFIFRRIINDFPYSDTMNLINIATVVIIRLAIVVIIRAWLPGR